MLTAFLFVADKYSENLSLTKNLAMRLSRNWRASRKFALMIDDKMMGLSHPHLSMIVSNGKWWYSYPFVLWDALWWTIDTLEADFRNLAEVRFHLTIILRSLASLDDQSGERFWWDNNIRIEWFALVDFGQKLRRTRSIILQSQHCPALCTIESPTWYSLGNIRNGK